MARLEPTRCGGACSPGADVGAGERSGGDATFERLHFVECAAQAFLGVLLNGDIPEDDHRSDQSTLLDDGSARVLDRKARAVFAEEHLRLDFANQPVVEGGVNRTVVALVLRPVPVRMMDESVHRAPQELGRGVARSSRPQPGSERGTPFEVEPVNPLAGGVQDEVMLSSDLRQALLRCAPRLVRRFQTDRAA